MTLYLVRHGESVGNKALMHQKDDMELSFDGVAQAEKVAKRLKSIKADLIYASPLTRAAQTAQIISTELGLPVESWGRIRERKRPGVLEGVHSESELSKSVNDLIMENFHKDDWHHSDEENFFDTRNRAVAVLEHLSCHHLGQNVICVTHGTFLKYLIGIMIFGPEMGASTYLDTVGKFPHSNTGITVCEYKAEKGWRLVTWNDSAHLG